MVIEFINPVIRGWGNYFKGGTVKKSFGELDGYIRGRSFEAKRRTLKILVFGIHPAEFAKMGLVSLSSMRNDLWGRKTSIDKQILNILKVGSTLASQNRKL